MSPRERWHRALDVQLDLHKWSLTVSGMTYHLGVTANVMADPRHGDSPDDQPVSDEIANTIGLGIADTGVSSGIRSSRCISTSTSTNTSRGQRISL